MRRQGREFQDRGNERRFGAGRPQFDKPRGQGDFSRLDSRGSDRPRSFEPRGERPQGRPWGNNERGASFDRPRTGTYRRDGGAQGGYGKPHERFNGRPASRFDDRGPSRDERSNDRTNERTRPSAPAPAPRVAAAPLVSAQQLKAGIGQANRALAEVVEQFGHTLRGDYDIGALEVTVSFDAEGRFLGFGAGGATSMKLSLTPLDAESIVEGEEGESAEDGDDFVRMAEDEAEDEDEDEADEEGVEETDEEDESEDEDEDEGEGGAVNERAAAPNGADKGGEAAHFHA